MPRLASYVSAKCLIKFTPRLATLRLVTLRLALTLLVVIAAACSSRVPAEHRRADVPFPDDDTFALGEPDAGPAAGEGDSGARGADSGRGSTSTSSDATGPDPAGGGDAGREPAKDGDPDAGVPKPRPDVDVDGGDDNSGEPTGGKPVQPPSRDNCGVAVEYPALTLPLWTLLVTDSEWDTLHAKPKHDIEVDAEVCVRDERLPIGLEIQGASSRKYPKKSYKLKFNRGVELEGHYFGTTRLIDKVIIKAMATDRSLIRERLAFELWRQMGHEAPRESSLNLQINGRYHGLYTLVEPVDKDYLRRRNIPTSGHMYKGVRKHGSFADFRPGRPLDRAFEDETYPEAPDYGPLSRLVSVIQDERGGPEAFAEAIATQLSVTDYIDRMIWISFTQNGDAVAQNFFLYRLEQANEPPWRFIPWDSNLSLGADWRSAESVIGADNGFQWSGGNLLAERILEVPEYREHFVARYLELLDTTFHPDTLMATFDAFAAQVSADMVLDQGRWEYPTDGEAGLGAIAEFLYVRAQYARERLSRF